MRAVFTNLDDTYSLFLKVNALDSVLQLSVGLSTFQAVIDRIL